MDEDKRLARVYSRYDADPGEQLKRDPTNAGNLYELKDREARLHRVLQTEGLLPIGQKRFLEVGCGYGYQLARMVDHGAIPELCYGMDILPDRIATAKLLQPSMHFLCADARRMAYESMFFDVVLCFVVFSSILDDTVAQGVAKEIDRVLKPEGVILWYDNRLPNPGNPDVRGYSRRDLGSMFPGYRLRVESVTLAPPIARRLGPFTAALYPLLAALPVLRVRLLGALRKASAFSRPRQ